MEMNKKMMYTIGGVAVGAAAGYFAAKKIKFLSKVNPLVAAAVGIVLIGGAGFYLGGMEMAKGGMMASKGAKKTDTASKPTSTPAPAAKTT